MTSTGRRTSVSKNDTKADRPRTLTEALRWGPDETLVAVLEHRPDLADAAPRDLAELVSRATTTVSTTRALDQLDAWQRVVVEALAALPDPVTVDEVAALLDAPPATTSATVRELRERALVWGPDDQLHLVRPAREAFLPYPGGLAPSSPRPLTDAQLDEALAACPRTALAVAERLLWSPTGVVRNAERRVSTAEARSPVEELLSRQLLRPVDTDTVILPREVAWRLRGGRFTAEPVPPTQPAVEGRARDARLVDRAAAGAAYALVHDVELVAHQVQTAPHRMLRTGGLGTRDVATLGRELGLPPDQMSFVLECAAAAGLVAPGPGYTLLPTHDYDAWARSPIAVRWRVLADGWLDAARFFARSTEPGAHTLGSESDSEVAGDLRRKVLGIAAAAGAGVVLDVDQLGSALAWQRPRLTGGTAQASSIVGWTWREAEWLGVVALGAFSSFGLALLDTETELPLELQQLFPESVDELIIQADLTAVAAGPLEYRMATDLRMLADQESRGGGGVFRFSGSSVRRAFDSGWSRDEVQTWVADHSRTGVPQPLAYLIDDVARRHGSVRVGPAGSFIRVTDEAQASALLSHPAAAGLGLRRVGPGVLVALADEADVVLALRDLGHAPAVEDASGVLLSAPPPERSSRPRPAGPTAESPGELAARLLRTERARPAPRPGASAATTEESLDRLRTATRDALPVRVVYANADGSSAERELAPLDVAGGTVRAIDRLSAQVVTIPLARISAVIPAGSHK